MFARRTTVRGPHDLRTRARVCSFERLESREMLSASGWAAIAAQPLLSPAYSGGQNGYTPAEIAHAYGVDQLPAFANGAAANGAGQTIAIIDACDDPTIASDLQTFDQAFHLPAPPSFTKVDEQGGTNYPAPDPGWSVESALDVEWAHAIAPGANILLVETASDQLTDLLAGVDYARHQPGVSVVSMSWGSSEFSQETTLDSYFTTPAGHAGVTFLAATGDGGAPANWPAVSPNVVAVGGTALLTFDATGTYRYETGWSCSGGGVSLFESAPAYQRGAVAGFGRSAPDVAWDADPMTGFAIYTTTTDSGPPGWTVMGGTSAATPQWAALVAIADQGRAVRGAAPLQSIPAALYQLPSSDFHDVAGGSNGLPCGPGYDMVTGLGTPYANRVVQGLVASTRAATPLSPTGSAGNLAKPAAKLHLTAKALVQEAAAKRPILAEDPAPRPQVTSNPIYRHPKDPNDPGDDFTAFVFHAHRAFRKP